MKTTTVISLAGLAAIGFAAFLTQSAFAEYPDNGPAELRALDSLIGDWKVEMTIGPNPDVRTVEMSSQWTLGKRYVLSKSKSENDELMTLWTFDPAMKVYRRWFFFSSGTTLHEVGHWDPVKQTFEFQSADPNQGLNTVSTIKIVDKDTKRWSVTLKANDGTTVTAKGTTTRCK